VLLAFRGLHPDGTDERAEYEAQRAAEAAAAASGGSAESVDERK
jgi:hypothetical protein